MESPTHTRSVVEGLPCPITSFKLSRFPQSFFRNLPRRNPGTFCNAASQKTTPDHRGWIPGSPRWHEHFQGTPNAIRRNTLCCREMIALVVFCAGMKGSPLRNEQFQVTHDAARAGIIAAEGWSLVVFRAAMIESPRWNKHFQTTYGDLKTSIFSAE